MPANPSSARAAAATKTPRNSPSQSGNAFVFVLLGVALFAALGYVFSRGMNQASGNLTRQQLYAYTSDIFSYSQQIESAVNLLRRNGCSESDLNFENPTVAGYVNPSAPVDNSCDVFHEEGGQVVWQSPPGGVNNGSQWIITGNMGVQGVGTDGGAAGNVDLVLILPNATKEFCIALNDKLSVANPLDVPPKADANATYTTKFIGAFAAGDELTDADLTGNQAGCFEGNGTPAAGTFHFYKVLYAR